MAKTLAEDLKWCVILLYSDGYSKKEIAKLLYIGETLVNKVIHIYAKWGCVVNPWRRLPGRKKVFSSSDMNVLREIVREHVDYYLDEYIEEMQLHKAASERNELLQSAFIATIGRYRTDQLVFMDESSKDDHTSTRLYGYSKVNSRAFKKVVFVRGKRYTLLPALIEQDIIVLPQMNPFPSKNSVLVLDNAKIHHDQELLDYLDAFGVKVEFLPPYSPDLNPIETAFSTIKQFLQRNRYFVEISYNHIYPLLIACSQITP
ncbi:unnamed protein product [Rhizophagus irregularis]|nr:unnamed protein product [Rhizophagus irregularis]